MGVDATTQAALEETILRWRVLAYGDFVGDTLRATSGLYDRTISGSGDSDLDGTYDAYPPEFVGISPVQHKEGGTNTVTISMSGLIVNNVDFLNLIGTKSNWQGRDFRVWFYCVDENETLVGDYIPFYTGYMNDVTISGSPEFQTVSVTIENYLNTLTGASNKNYLSQAQYDSGDLSANATIAAANGLNSSGGGGIPAGGGGGSYPGTDPFPSKEYAR